MLAFVALVPDALELVKVVLDQAIQRGGLGVARPVDSLGQALHTGSNCPAAPAANRILTNWDRNDSCPDGAFDPFNIDAKINGAYVALGLLYGKGDFRRTLEIATRSGQDSDCNPSSAAGVLGQIP